MTKTPAFVEVWLTSLAVAAEGLNLSDSEDRATFRGNVAMKMRHLKWSGMVELATYLGVKVPRNRSRACHRIATAYAEILGTKDER